MCIYIYIRHDSTDYSWVKSGQVIGLLGAMFCSIAGRRIPREVPRPGVSLRRWTQAVEDSVVVNRGARKKTVQTPGIP